MSLATWFSAGFSVCPASARRSGGPIACRAPACSLGGSGCVSEICRAGRSPLLKLFEFDANAFFTTVACLAAAFTLGCLIGLERQIRQRNAGLRTVVLVCVGSAAFV